MKKTHVFLLFLLMSHLLLGGKLALKVDKTTITQGDEVTITLTAHGKDITFPTLKSIGGYPVTSSGLSQGFSATFGNGNASAQYQKSIRFSFAPEHNITIPSLSVTIDGAIQKTQPTPLLVLPAGHVNTSKGGFRLTMHSTRKSVYVGEAFLVQVIFYEPRNSNIAQAQYTAPKFDGFFVKSSPQERLENTPQGTEHIFDYILTPQKEGNITLTAPRIKLGIQTFSGTRDPWGFFSNEVHWKSLRGTPHTLTVKPLPTSTDIVGTFRLKATATPRKVKANKPVNYTLSIEGKGSLEEMDDPTFDLPDVTVYSDDAKVDTRIEKGQVISQWIKKYTFIADHDFTIPSVHLTTFDPTTAQDKPLTTQPVTIRIYGAKSHTTLATPPSDSVQKGSTPLTQAKSSAVRQTLKTDTNDSLFEDTTYYAKQAQKALGSTWPWWALVLSFVTGILLTLVATWATTKFSVRTKKRTKKYTPTEALELLYPHTNDSPEIEEMVRDLYRVKQGEKRTIDSKKLERILQKISRT